MKVAIITIILFVAGITFGQANIDRSTRHAAADTNIIFSSPYPLIMPADSQAFRNAYGFDLLFSTFGFGAGAFYRHQYSDQIFGFVHLVISGAKDGIELDRYDPSQGTTFVPGKQNRFFLFPLMAGIQYRVLKDAIVENFRPYLAFGVGPTAIMATPADDEFFHSFGRAKTVYSPSGFVGIGANFGSDKKSVAGVTLRYYIIPYNGTLQSIAGQTIHDFNSVFLGLTIGFAY